MAYGWEVWDDHGWLMRAPWGMSYRRWIKTTACGLSRKEQREALDIYRAIG